MKKITLYSLIFLMLCNTVVFGSAKEDKLKIVSESAILMDAKTGRILYEKNPQKPMAMASTTKIMTAIIAIENGNLDELVTISKNATRAPKVKMYLKEGEKISLRNLLYALMMQSSNDAAISVAEHISGSSKDFCIEMTNKAKSLGANDTIFKTPNGLDLEDHHSTAYDMALIARYALKNKTFMDIINTKNIAFTTNKSSYNISNKNRLLCEFKGANGIKTGYTNKAGHCFIGSATRGDMTLISVVFASGWGARGKTQKWADTKTLLNYGFDNFKYEKILDENSLDNKLLISNNKNSTLGIKYETDIIIPISEVEKSKIEIKNNYPNLLSAPIYKNQKIGTSNIFIGDKLITNVDVLATEDISPNTFYWYFKNILRNWSNIIK